MSRRRTTRSLALCAVVAIGLSAAGLTASLGQAAGKGRGGVKLNRIGRFDQPTFVTGAPGYPKLLFVTERGGTVRVVKRGRKRRRPFLNIRGLVGTGFLEQGLLSIAFPPDYRRSKRFYVFFTDNRGDIRVEEFRRRSPTRARRGSRRLVIEISHRANDNHNGGQLQFLGNLLYLSTGDGGGAGDPPNNAQNKDRLLGKILRIDPSNPSGSAAYSVPSDNPFVGSPGADEVFSYGLRNPFRFSFDRSHGKTFILIADVGQARFEEVDYETLAGAAGANFGWDAFEGFAQYDGGSPDPGGTRKPILAYGRDRGCTVIGGYVVRAGGPPSLRGRYLYADYCEGQLRSFVPALGGARKDRRLGPAVPSPSSFGQDLKGRVYVASLNGPVFRLVPR